MFSYAARALHVAARARMQPRLRYDEVGLLKLRARPQDCDQNKHLNNGRYLIAMDYGRFAWFARTRMLDAVIRERIPLLIAGIDITYRREIPVDTTYTLETSLGGWDESWVYFVQTFRNEDGAFAARALVRGAIRKAGEPWSTERFLAASGFPGAGMPELPADIRAWQEQNRQTMRIIRREGRKPYEDGERLR